MILWEQFSVEAAQTGTLEWEEQLYCVKSFFFFPLVTMTELCARKRSPKLSGPVTVRLFFLFFPQKSRDLSCHSGVQKLAHTSGITAQTWRQCVTNSSLPFRHSAAPLEQMGDECRREERTLFINSFFFFIFPVCPHFPSQPVMLYESLTHFAATN